jgi:hypothetical protein
MDALILPDSNKKRNSSLGFPVNPYRHENNPSRNHAAQITDGHR